MDFIIILTITVTIINYRHCQDDHNYYEGHKDFHHDHHDDKDHGDKVFKMMTKIMMLTMVMIFVSWWEEEAIAATNKYGGKN